MVPAETSVKPNESLFSFSSMQVINVSLCSHRFCSLFKSTVDNEQCAIERFQLSKASKMHFVKFETIPCNTSIAYIT